jgi:hypothetical protein
MNLGPGHQSETRLPGFAQLQDIPHDPKGKNQPEGMDRRNGGEEVHPAMRPKQGVHCVALLLPNKERWQTTTSPGLPHS